MNEFDVPLVLKHFVKTIVYTFYDSPHVAIISVLVNYSMLDENTFIELLQIDKKQFRSAISLLKNDKIIRQRILKEKNVGTGASTTFYFYYINYYLVLNSVRYKLEKVRQSLITEEKSATDRASFSCQNCLKQFPDLEINQLLNMETGQMTCYQCGCEVVENNPDRRARPTDSIIAKYNQQFEPIFKLIERCLTIEFTPDLVEPEPTEAHIQQACFSLANQNEAVNSIKRQRTLDLGKQDSSLSKYVDQSINIKIGDEAAESVVKSKPHPEWLVENASADMDVNTKGLDSKKATLDVSRNNDASIMENLILFEAGERQLSDRLSDSELSSENEQIDFPEGIDLDDELKIKPSLESPPSTPASEPSPVISQDNGDNEGDDLTAPCVKINDKEYEIDQITEDMLAKMTQEEHDTYIKLLNDIYKTSF